MHASVRAMLDQIIDYAGLFPPAKLPLEDALNQYLHARKHSPYQWILGRFVCPTGRLHELLPLAKAHTDGVLLQVTALGQQSATASEILSTLQADMQAITDFRRTWGSDAVIVPYEVALPQGSALERLAAQQVADQLHHAQLRGFLEVPMIASWADHFVKVCKSLEGTEVGVKLRTGGLAETAFPTDMQIAFFIDRCRSANLPWKATAGLHHPRRHWDASLQVWHHGFLNVFGAGLLAWSNTLTEADLVAILSDRDGDRFRFEDDRFSWGEWSCTSAQIVAGRANFATSFGSCSFAEPCDDLIAMGLLDPA